MSGKTIEIEKGDTFTFDKQTGTVYVWHGAEYVGWGAIDGESENEGGEHRKESERDISRADALTLLRIYGAPFVEMESVPTVTVEWGVQDESCGLVMAFDSREHATKKAEGWGRGHKLVRIRFGGASNG